MEKQAVELKWLCSMQLLLFSAIWLATTLGQRVEAQSSSPILRTRGLIIEDSSGHARILLGAPFPSVTERTRQDSTTTAIVFLDEKGHDRLTLGEEPEPQVFGRVSTAAHRISPGFGVVIHDGDGNERGTYGWLARGRALITLDRPGLDAWAAVVDDKTCFAGMRVEYAPDVANDKDGIEIGTQGKKAIVRLMDTKQRNRAVLQLGDDGSSSFQAFNEEGRPTRDLLKSEKPDKRSNPDRK